MTNQELIAALGQFVLDNPELERLEAIVRIFNPFVAMRWTRQEVKHSTFLSWLLNPRETHGPSGGNSIASDVPCALCCANPNP